MSMGKSKISPEKSGMSAVKSEKVWDDKYGKVWDKSGKVQISPGNSGMSPVKSMISLGKSRMISLGKSGMISWESLG